MFDDRVEAGRELALALRGYRDRQPVVLGMARGGIPVACEVAGALGASLDVIVVRKLGAPDNPEFAIGALAPGVTEINRGLVGLYGISPLALDGLIERERHEMERRERLYRGNRSPLSLEGRTVILIDDGLATGASAMAATASVRVQRPAHVVFGAPVCACDSVQRMRREVDDIVCVMTPADFRAVSLWYRDFRPTTDGEVRDCLERVAHHRAASSSSDG